MRAGLGQEDNLQSLPAKIAAGRLPNSSQLSKEDRDEILKDRAVFGLDYPQEEVAPILEPTRINAIRFVVEEKKADRKNISLNRMRRRALESEQPRGLPGPGLEGLEEETIPVSVPIPTIPQPRSRIVPSVSRLLGGEDF